MGSNSFGRLLTVTTFGESHGRALGAVVDGCPAGIGLEESDLQVELDRRRPGTSSMTTSRVERDRVSILSGVFEGRTTGAPIAAVVANENQRSRDYEHLRHAHRPGHADRTYDLKYGHRDHRGGGRSSGRETLARVIGGVVARKVLPSEVRILGHALQVGPVRAVAFEAEEIERNPMRCADPKAAAGMVRHVRELAERHDSAGGLVEVRVTGVPIGLGDPVFDKLKARCGAALLGIGAVTGFSYGAGFDVVARTGSELAADPEAAGGILGGISSGEDLLLRIAVKPTSSIGDTARRGRHDPCIVPRIIPVAEAMVALVLADAWLVQRAAGGPARV